MQLDPHDTTTHHCENSILSPSLPLQEPTKSVALPSAIPSALPSLSSQASPSLNLQIPRATIFALPEIQEIVQQNENLQRQLAERELEIHKTKMQLQKLQGLYAEISIECDTYKKRKYNAS